MVKTGSILFKNTLRTIKRNLRQFIAVIIISLLAVTLYVGLTASAKKIEKRMDYLYRESNAADLYVYYNEIKDTDYNFIKNLDGVIEAYKRLYLPVNIGSNDYYLIGDDEAKLSRPIIYEGEEGFVIPEYLLKLTGIQIGDNLKFKIDERIINAFSGSLEKYLIDKNNNPIDNGKVEISLKVTGIMYHPEACSNAEYTTGIVYAKQSLIKEALIKFFEAYYDPTIVNVLTNYINTHDLSNQIIAKTDNSIANASFIRTYYRFLNAEGENNFLLVLPLSEQSFYLGLKNEVDQARKLTYVFPMVFLLVAILVISTTLAQIILKERTQIGTLKALGLTKGEVIFNYVFLGVFLIGIGLILGLIIGPILIPKVMDFKYNLLWNLPDVNNNWFYWEYLIISFAAIIITFIVCVICSYSEVKLTPAESMRPKKPTLKKIKATKLPISIKMAFRNIINGMGKSIMVVIGILGCSSLLVCGYGILDTIYHGIDIDSVNIMTSDIVVDLSYDGSNFPISEIKNIPGIKEVKILKGEPSSVRGSKAYTINVYTYNPDTMDSPIFKNKPGLLISKRASEEIGANIGDMIEMTLGKDNVSLPIDEIYESSIYRIIFIREDLVKEISLPIVNLWIDLFTDADNVLIKDELIKYDFIYKVNTKEDLNETAHSLLSNIEYIVYVVKFFAIALAIVVIYNLASLNMQQRYRDIATMKVLGFNKKEIILSLVTESTILTIIGIMCGLLCGYPLLYVVLKINETDLFTYVYYVKPISYVISFAIAFVTSVVINLIQSFKIKNIRMVESLKSVE